MLGVRGHLHVQVSNCTRGVVDGVGGVGVGHLVMDAASFVQLKECCVDRSDASEELPLSTW